MTHSNAFTAGIAGGSVTDWREYDCVLHRTIHGAAPVTTRKAIDRLRPSMAEKLHGQCPADSRRSRTTTFIPPARCGWPTALQKAGKDFRLMIYPGAAHAIHDPQQVWHLMRMTDRFLVAMN